MAEARVIPLIVIHAPDARSIVDVQSVSDPIRVRGEGPLSFSCGQCGRLLIEGVEPGDTQVMTFACACGAYNATIEFFD
jgi:hypothetical protein